MSFFLFSFTHCKHSNSLFILFHTFLSSLTPYERAKSCYRSHSFKRVNRNDERDSPNSAWLLLMGFSPEPGLRSRQRNESDLSNPMNYPRRIVRSLTSYPSCISLFFFHEVNRSNSFSVMSRFPGFTISFLLLGKDANDWTLLYCLSYSLLSLKLEVSLQ